MWQTQNILEPGALWHVCWVLSLELHESHWVASRWSNFTEDYQDSLWEFMLLSNYQRASSVALMRLYPLFILLLLCRHLWNTLDSVSAVPIFHTLYWLYMTHNVLLWGHVEFNQLSDDVISWIEQNHEVQMESVVVVCAAMRGQGRSVLIALTWLYAGHQTLAYGT